MLLLKRELGETIQIGNDITIIVCRVSGRSVKLGIEAPKDVPVWRGEIADAKRREKEGGKP